MQKGTIIAPIEKVSKIRILLEKVNKRRILPILLFIALVATSSMAVYFYLQTVKPKKTPQELAQQEVKDIVAKVSLLIVLPEGETPTIATVTDPKLLKDQAFFSKAQKGDQVLIYTNAKKAILYNPTTNKIVDVAPVNIGNTPAVTPTISPTTPKNP
jgi:hypothetical protein